MKFDSISLSPTSNGNNHFEYQIQKDNCNCRVVLFSHHSDHLVDQRDHFEGHLEQRGITLETHELSSGARAVLATAGFGTIARIAEDLRYCMPTVASTSRDGKVSQSDVLCDVLLSVVKLCKSYEAVVACFGFWQSAVDDPNVPNS